MNIEAPTASRNARGYDVRLPWCATTMKPRAPSEYHRHCQAAVGLVPEEAQKWGVIGGRQKRSGKEVDVQLWPAERSYRCDQSFTHRARAFGPYGPTLDGTAVAPSIKFGHPNGCAGVGQQSIGGFKVPIRKRLVELASPKTAPAWLAVDQLAQIEVTSEDHAHPIDSALIDGGCGWRASQSGEQLIRLVFDEPQALRLIHLVFEEADQERVQEFTLRWSSDRGLTYKPIVRQQFSFSPSGATREVEDYDVRLSDVTELELQIIPDISRRRVVANLREFRLR